MKKGFSMKEMPPEHSAVQQKTKEIMMRKMQVARQAEQTEMSKAATGNKIKGKEFLALLSKHEGVKKTLQDSTMKSSKLEKAQVPQWITRYAFTITAL